MKRLLPLLALLGCLPAFGQKISALSSGQALAGSELVPMVQAGATVTTTPAALATYLTSVGGFASLDLAQTWTALQAFGLDISIGGVTPTGVTGTGNLVFGTSPTLVTPNLGTPSAIDLANATGLPVSALPSSGVTAGSYTDADITVDQYGLITAASNGSGGMTWPAAAGIPCYASSAWCTSYSATNTIPADFLAAIPISGLSGLGTGMSGFLALAWPSLVSGDCLTNNGTALSWGTCGSGSGITLQTNGANNASQTTLNLVGTGGVSVTNPSGGTIDIGPVSESVNAQTGTTYTIATTDCGKQITFSNSGAIAVTVPQANGSFAGCQFDVTDIGAGTATLTPTTSTINGAASLAVAQNQQCTLNSDGTNWQVIGCTALASAGSGITLENAGTSLGTVTTLNCSTGTTCTASSGVGTVTASGGSGAQLNVAQTWGAAQTFPSGDVILQGSGTGGLALIYPYSGSANTTISFPLDTSGMVAITDNPNTWSATQIFSGGTSTKYVTNSGTTFTVSSGTGACATTSTLTGGASAGSLTCTGTTGASTVTVSLPGATHGWVCDAHDIATPANDLALAAETTTSAEFSGTVNQNDAILFKCMGF